MALIDKLSAIGDAIREKTGTTDLLTLDQMPDVIEGIETGGGDLPEEAFVITGNCQYRFAYDAWNWFITTYGDKITSQNIIEASHMFEEATNLKHIPFDLNIYDSASVELAYLFKSCSSLTSLPRLNDAMPGGRSGMFMGCYNLREIPEDYDANWDYSHIDNQTGGYSCNSSIMFQSCFSLRKLPMNFLKHGNPKAVSSYSIYPSMVYGCYCLDEIVDLPNPHNNVSWTSNAFTNTFNNCHRLKRLTFKNDIGAVEWKNQTIGLNQYIGYAGSIKYILDYNSGILLETRITDDATYQLYKDHPDAWTTDINYSRYNHDSAVETINSLPDTSAYLATAGGTNTITFKGASGALTDGGAINTLTEEEIAVATAKGWTVSFG